MIVRNKNSESVICISQVHHSAMTGEIARQWNPAFLKIPEPAADVVLAAALHDIGWSTWEESPDIDPKTGHPYHFLEMPKTNHLDIWKQGFERSIVFSRLTGILVLRHNVYLAGKQ